MDTSQPSGPALEYNFDGLVGPTHNYAGLAPGNLASWNHRSQISNPRAAALEGLAKMRILSALGVPQAVLPPQPRPDVDMLRRVGFVGDDAAVLDEARKRAPLMLAKAASGSSMWTANAATVCPSADAADSRLHFTPANLVSSLHRAIETETTTAVLKQIFHAPGHFRVHDPLPASTDMGDEGAANHTRFCDSFDSRGIQLFVYGTAGRHDTASSPQRFPARQTRQASEAVARLHHLDLRLTVFAKQHPKAIDAGVFHNDVIAVGHRNLLFCHASAFDDPSAVYESLRRCSDGGIQIVEVTEEQLSVADAVSTYLFNSQLVTTADGATAIVAPQQCHDHPQVCQLLKSLQQQKIFQSVHYVDVGQSMNNGGGPACLRLRVVLTPSERAAIAANVFVDDALLESLTRWITRHYRDRISQDDLADPKLLQESYAALDELTGLLDIGPVYRFQR